MFAFKDSTAIHWLVALINKKSSQSKKQDQRKKKVKRKESKQVSFVRENITQVSKFYYKVLHNNFFYMVGTFDSNKI